MAESDYYQLLGVEPTASLTDIKKAYRLKAHILHPDKGGHKLDFEALKTAYETLCSPVQRAAYDRLIVTTRVPSFGDNTNQAVSSQSSRGWRNYDPFHDPLYDSRAFFQPSHPNVEGMERHERAEERHCTQCHGMGRLTRLVYPDEGFFGIQERLCGCQLLGDL